MTLTRISEDQENRYFELVDSYESHLLVTVELMVCNLAVRLAYWESYEKKYILQIQYRKILKATVGHVCSVQSVQY